jgi:dephospho-CoA kinase
MLVIGLTGGIGAGKSTVSGFLKMQGYPVIDADEMARGLTAKGSPVLQEIEKRFGSGVILADGSLDRKKLASIVFGNAEKKKLLEEITTSVVFDKIKKQVSDLRDAGTYDIIFVDAPLLYETGADRLTDMVWLVTADDEVRIKRVMARDGATREQVEERIANQMSQDEKKQRSKELIDNSRGKEELFIEICGLLEKYAKWQENK